MKAFITTLLIASLVHIPIFSYTKKFSYRQIKPIPCNSKETEQQPIVPNTCPEDILEHYQCMKDVHEILTFHAIEYWIDGGTLIGAIRHKGMIPWDNDLDIGMHIADKDRLTQLFPIFDALGYVTIEVLYGYRIHSKKTACGVDIFFWNKENDVYIYNRVSPLVWGYRNQQPIYMTANELYPLKKYTFGLFTVLGPNDPLAFLNAMYGDDWQDVGYKYDHTTTVVKDHMKMHTKEKVYLTKKDKVPARPFYPIIDRTSGILCK